MSQLYLIIKRVNIIINLKKKKSKNCRLTVIFSSRFLDYNYHTLLYIYIIHNEVKFDEALKWRIYHSPFRFLSYQKISSPFHIQTLVT